MAVTSRTAHRSATDHAAPRLIEPDGVDREGAGFDLQMRGYARDQVEHRIHEWATAYDALELERDQLLTELTELRGRPQQLTPLASMSARVAGIVEAAEAEAAALQASAQRVADAIVADAREAADADLDAAAQERDHAAAEAERVLTEAQEEADRLRAEAQTAAEQTHAAIAAETERVRAVLAEQETQILAAARLEAAELERSNAHLRDIAEAEHARLLAAHAQQQKLYAGQLRAEIAELASRRAEAEADLARIRQLVGSEPVALAPAPLASFLHTGDTGENPLPGAVQVGAGPSRPVQAHGFGWQGGEPPTTVTGALPPVGDDPETEALALTVEPETGELPLH